MAARVITLLDNGEVRLREDSANGVNYVGHKAAASVTSTYTVEWPGAPPGSTQFLQMDSSGVISFNPTGAGTLDDGYDSGGAGAGRIIIADTGPVEAAGAGGFLASHSAPVYGLETTGAERNYRLTAGQTAGIAEIQVGDADGDISDDVFTVLLALDGANRRLGLGTVAPATLAHLLAPAATDAKLTLQAPATFDASVIFNEDSTARFEVGYDDSAGGLVVGRLSFSNPAIFVEDTTGDVGIGELVPDARLHVTSAAVLTGLIESSQSTARLGLRASGTVDENEVGIQANGNGIELIANAAPQLVIDASGASDATVGIGVTTPLAKLHIINDVASTRALRVEQNANAPAIRLDSAATSAPTIDLTGGLTTNSHGDIHFLNRTADPTTPTEGQFWYDATNGVFKYYDGTTTQTLAVV